MPNWVAAKNENGNFRSDFNGPIMHNFGQKLDSLCSESVAETVYIVTCVSEIVLDCLACW